jgi:gamma-glutamylcyclotransferase (GGCT)/AIG2-like uncharacterized protein YtfP
MSLYVAGRGTLSREEIAIDLICRKHDERLVFRRNPKNGHMTIFQRLARDNAYVRYQSDNLVDGDLFPVIAYPGRMPSPDEVNKWLYEHDAYRYDLLDQVQKRNKQRVASAQKEYESMRTEGAVRLEHLIRKDGGDTGRYVSARPNPGKRRRNY